MDINIWWAGLVNQFGWSVDQKGDSFSNQVSCIAPCVRGRALMSVHDTHPSRPLCKQTQSGPVTLEWPKFNFISFYKHSLEDSPLFLSLILSPFSRTIMPALWMAYIIPRRSPIGCAYWAVSMNNIRTAFNLPACMRGGARLLPI